MILRNIKNFACLVLLAFLINLLGCSYSLSFNEKANNTNDHKKATTKSTLFSTAVSTIIAKEEQNEETYILNLNTFKFHKPHCYHIKKMNEENKYVFIGTKEKLIYLDYSPCGTCKP